MKQKKPGKKLNLNKKTIAALDSRQIKAVYGGDPGESDCPCRIHCGTEYPSSCLPTDTQDPTIYIVCCY
jgi:natural product precursor